MFYLSVRTTNDAFHDKEELPRILRETADRLAARQTEGPIRDINGNAVGGFGFKEDNEGA